MSDISVDEAKVVLEKESRERATKCAEEIKAVLDKHGCKLVPTMSIVAG